MHCTPLIHFALWCLAQFSLSVHNPRSFLLGQALLCYLRPMFPLCHHLNLLPNPYISNPWLLRLRVALGNPSNCCLLTHTLLILNLHLLKNLQKILSGKRLWLSTIMLYLLMRLESWFHLNWEKISWIINRFIESNLTSTDLYNGTRHG